MTLPPGQGPGDAHRDPAVVARVRAIGGALLAARGVDPGAARRAHGWSNFTWLAGGYALRVAAAPGDEDLHREARLAALLPPEVGYPEVVDLGVAEGHAWVLAREVPGENLSEVWDRLTADERRRAMLELWAKAEAVHAVRGAEVGRHARPVSPFYPAGPAEAEARVERLARAGLLPSQADAAVRAALARFWPALPLGRTVLNHGDLATLNALWHEGRVSCLLDFEFAVLAPAELDANEVLKKAYEENEPALRPAVPDAVAASLRELGAADRLLGYAVLLEMWDVENELKHRPTREELVARGGYRNLISLADGRGGFLAPTLARLA